MRKETIMFDSTWFLSAAIVCVSAGLQSITGFGFALLAVPSFMMILPARVAVCTNMTISFCSLLMLSWRTRRHADLGRLRWLLLGSIAGIPLGTYIVARCEPRIVRTIASASTGLMGIIYLVRALARKRGNQRPGNGPALLRPSRYVPVGVVSGVLAASVSMPGPPVILLLNHEGVGKDAFRATCGAYFAATYCVSIPTLALSGVMTIPVVAFAATLIPLALLGNVLGDRLFDRVSQPLFEKAVPVLLILTALSNMVRG